MLGPLVRWGVVFELVLRGLGWSLGGVSSGVRLGFGLRPCLGLASGVPDRGWFQGGAWDCGVGSLDVWVSGV